MLKEIMPANYSNVDRLTLQLQRTVTSIMKRNASLRFPPMPIDFPKHNYNLADALIEALAEMGYTPAVDELFKLCGEDYDAEATRALARLAPARVTAELLTRARDKATRQLPPRTLAGKALQHLSDQLCSGTDPTA